MREGQGGYLVSCLPYLTSPIKGRKREEFPYQGEEKKGDNYIKN